MRAFREPTFRVKPDPLGSAERPKSKGHKPLPHQSAAASQQLERTVISFAKSEKSRHGLALVSPGVRLMGLVQTFIIRHQSTDEAVAV